MTNLLHEPSIQGYVLNYHNISDRKQVEEKLKQTESFYRTIAEQSLEGIVVTDATFKSTYVSPSELHTSLGIAKPLGFNRNKIIHSDDLKEFQHKLAPLDSGQTFTGIFRMKNQEDNWDWFESRITNLLHHPAVQGYVIHYYKINERKAAEDAQDQLTKRLMTVQEEERRTIARELHDELGQSLTAIKVCLQTLRQHSSPETLTQAMTITDQVISQIRELSLDLHPSMLDDLGLLATIRWYTIEQSKRSGISIEFALALEEVNVPAELKLNIYRVIQEGLTNIIRHSHARNVSITLVEHANELILRIKDDGVGFDTNAEVKTSLGLVSMHERIKLHKGHFELTSIPNQGTELCAIFLVRGDIDGYQNSFS